MTAKVFSIAPDTPFLKALAEGVLSRYGATPEMLASVTVLLPSRRSVRAFKDALMDAAGGASLLLPSIQSIGDVEEDEIGLVLAQEAQLLPAVTPSQRLLLLARQIEAWKPKPDADVQDIIPSDQAVQLAHQLGALLDDMQREELSFDALTTLVPESLARHWQRTVDFLSIVSEAWPKILSEKNVVDAVSRRNALLKKQIAMWQASPPKSPIIAAGTTGSLPATRLLLAALIGLEHGMVVLPGLDESMPESEWNALPQSHPQFGLRQLLDALKVARGAVKPWGGRDCYSTRVALLREALRSAATTDRWRESVIPPDAVKGLSLFSFPTQQKEAEAISVMLREVLEKPQTTACLITTDRKLAKRVSSLMQRWGIEVNDSAGQPLMELPVISFMRLLAMAAQRRFSPVALLSCLKHPLASGGMQTAAFRANVRELERGVLRGVQPAAGLEGVMALLAEDKNKLLLDWFESLAAILSPLASQFKGSDKVPLADMVSAHIGVAESMASTESEKGSVRLWQGDEGASAADAVNEILDAAKDYGTLDHLYYPGLFDALLLGKVYRPRFGTHPRLSILSPIEARLLQFDRVIMASMNQGSWPHTGVSPWMSRGMAEECNLPGDERRISLAAHDFAGFASAPEVIITRAEKVDGAPSIASMFLLRLSAVMKGAGLEAAAMSPQWAAWAEHTFASAATTPPLMPPQPTPPVAARPRELSATTIEKLMRDPYAVYAGKILRLRPLDPLEQDPSAADFGNFIHKALELFTVGKGQQMERSAALRHLLACGKQAFTPLEKHPSVYALWWPRFEKVAEWLVEHEQERGSANKQIFAEIKGRHGMNVGGYEHVLTAKADRIELDGAGQATIIDYKSGTPPTDTEVKAGFSPQLMVEGIIALAGGFEGLPPVDAIAGLEYWKTGLGSGFGKSPKPKAYDPNAIEGLKQLIEYFTKADSAYLACPDPKNAPNYNDFEHLERSKEWI